MLHNKVAEVGKLPWNISTRLRDSVTFKALKAAHTLACERLQAWSSKVQKSKQVKTKIASNKWNHPSLGTGLNPGRVCPWRELLYHGIEVAPSNDSHSQANSGVGFLGGSGFLLRDSTSIICIVYQSKPAQSKFNKFKKFSKLSFPSKIDWSAVNKKVKSKTVQGTEYKKPKLLPPSHTSGPQTLGSPTELSKWTWQK